MRVAFVSLLLGFLAVYDLLAQSGTRAFTDRLNPPVYKDKMRISFPNPNINATVDQQGWINNNCLDLVFENDPFTNATRICEGNKTIDWLRRHIGQTVTVEFAATR